MSDKVSLSQLKKLVQADNFSWLIRAVKPFIWAIIGIALMNIFNSAAAVCSAILSKQMVDNAVSGNVAEAIAYILLFVAAHLVILIMGTLSSRFSVELYEKLSYRIEQELLERLYNSQWTDLSRFHSGDILTRFTDDIGKIAGMWVNTVPSVFGLGVQLVLALTVLLNYDPLLAILALILGPVSILIAFLFGLKLKKIQYDIQSASSRHRSYVTELIQHISVVKAFQYEKESLSNLIQKQNDKFRVVLKRNRLGIAAGVIVAGGYWIGYMLAFIYGVFKLADKTVSFGKFTAFLQLVSQIHQPFMGLAQSVPQIVSTLASVERIIELENLRTEEELGLSQETVKKEDTGINLENICFAYKSGQKVLDNASLKVAPGRIIALIGSSGEGKTTLMRLLLAFLQAESGSSCLELKGRGTLKISPGTRGFFSYVPQGNTLFSGTIADNLRVGKPDATGEELDEAVRIACAKEFIDELPDGLDTFIGEGGLGLSEGQAQRLCIARAVLRPAPVLLLDEATSALDMDTEKAVFENIKKLNRTCIAITHRLSVLPMCDAVFRIENGKIYEHSTDEFASILNKEKQWSEAVQAHTE